MSTDPRAPASICSRTTTVLGLRILAKRLVYARSYALEHYEDLPDINRAIVHTNVLRPEVSVLVSQN